MLHQLKKILKKSSTRRYFKKIKKIMLKLKDKLNRIEPNTYQTVNSNNILIFIL